MCFLYLYNVATQQPYDFESKPLTDSSGHEYVRVSNAPPFNRTVADPNKAKIKTQLPTLRPKSHTNLTNPYLTPYLSQPSQASLN
jgi:hypothetical protein